MFRINNKLFSYLFLTLFSVNLIICDNSDKENKINIAKKLSFKFSLDINNKYFNGISRKLSLFVNDDLVGYVSYNISLIKTDPSYIQYLFVYKPYRASHGYGKTLLTNCIADIISNGSRYITLHRHPFDLLPGDDFATRDMQLKQWYQKFGFEDKDVNASMMVLKDFEKFYKINLFSCFSDSDIKFTFSSELKNI